MKKIVTINKEFKEFQNDNHLDNDVSASFMLNYLQKSRVTFTLTDASKIKCREIGNRQNSC